MMWLIRLLSVCRVKTCVMTHSGQEGLTWAALFVPVGRLCGLSGLCDRLRGILCGTLSQWFFLESLCLAGG